jgi:small conductance mechanosensitive channel
MAARMIKVRSFSIEQFYDKVYNWLLTFGPNIIIAILLAVIGWWLIRVFIRRLHFVFDKRKVDTSLKPFLISLIDITLQLLLFLVIMQELNVKLTLFASLIAAIGVATGLALSGTLQNFTSGVLILLLKPYRVGDSIIAQGQEGIVESIEIFYTVVTTYDNRTVIIPNSKLSNEVIINISREGNRRLDIEFKFPFGADYKQIENILNTSISKMTSILETPESRIGVSSIEPDGYRIMVNVWISAHGFQDTKLKIQQQLLDDLKSNGIKLPGM